MQSIASQVRALFVDAEDYFHICKFETAHAFYLAGATLLPQVGHPLEYLELVLIQEALLRTYVVPNMMAV